MELSEEYAISCFLKGLKAEIEVQVRMLSPRILMKAYSLAKLAKHSLKLQLEQLQSVVRSSRTLLPTPSSYWNNSTPKNLNAIQSAESSKGVVGNENRVPNSYTKPVVKGTRRLSCAELMIRGPEGYVIGVTKNIPLIIYVRRGSNYSF